MKRTILSVAVLVACASQASASLTARYLLEGDKTFAEDITCAVASNFGIYAHGSGNAGTFTGQTISVDVSEAAGLATGVYAGKGGKIVIGDRDKSVVTIRTKDTGVVKDSLSYGLWVNGQENLGGQMEVKGKSVTIHAEGEGQTDVRAIHVATNTLKPSQRSSLLIDADTVSITADGEGARAIVAMSTGVVEVKGKATIAADNAIVARGDAKVLVNAEGKYSTVINGNVNFSYDAPTSKTPVDATVILNLVGPESSWRGNTVVSWNGKPTSVDEYLSVTGMKLGLSKGAAWTPVETAKDSTTANVGAKYTALNLLENNDGVINITGSAIDVTVEKMTGTGGTVNLAADLTAEEGSRTGTITIAEADENSKIDVKLKDAKMERNLTSDDLTAEEAKSLMAAGVDAAENVGVTSTVEEGMYNDGFRIDEEGATTSTGPNSVMQSTLELAAAAPFAINRILMNDVRKRLGDIRTSQGTSGVWARYDGGRLSGSAGLENDFHTIQAGVDTVPGDSSIRFGAALSYTGSEADYRRGNADMDLYGLSAYGLWMGEAGQFVDVVGRLASAKTDMTVDGGKKGSMDNVALSLSGEVGWRFDVSSLFYVEPQVEATYTFVNADRLELSDGSNYEFDDAHSLLGRAGMAFGVKCPNEMGSVHARVSAVHEFLGDLKVTGGNGAILETDGKDTWVEYGLGVNFNLTPATYFWADVERTSGGVLDEDWRATVGVRHAFCSEAQAAREFFSRAAYFSCCGRTRVVSGRNLPFVQLIGRKTWFVG